jgi:hypothetical protein
MHIIKRLRINQNKETWKGADIIDIDITIYIYMADMRFARGKAINKKMETSSLTLQYRRSFSDLFPSQEHSTSSVLLFSLYL